MGDYYSPVPTVVPASPFDALEDATALKSSMKGLGTDEEVIIGILSQRSNTQRQEIAKLYAEEYDSDIIDDLKGELGGHFEEVIVALMRPPADYLCKQLNKAMDGAGTEESTLVEILCSKNNQEIQDIVDAYERLYERPLAEHMCSETSGDLRRLLTLIVTEGRDQSKPRGPDYVLKMAKELHNAGEFKIGTDESVFNRILAHESFPQLKLIFEAYKEVSGRTIEQALQDEISGDLLEALLAIVENVQHPPTYFAKRIHDAVFGAGTDDKTLIRIIVSRSEIDLQSIKEEFEKLYDKTLASVIEGETTGDYNRALIALIGGA